MSKVERFKVGTSLSEKIPTQRYGNIDMGPYVIEYEVVLDKPLEASSPELQKEVDKAFVRAKDYVETAYGDHREQVVRNLQASE